MVLSHDNLLEAQSLYKQALLYSKENKTDKAIETFDILLTKFPKSNSRDIELLLVKTLVRKAFSLGKLGQTDEEISIYSKVFSSYSDHADEKIKEEISMAHTNYGYSNLILAKQHWKNISVREEFLKSALKHTQLALDYLDKNLDKRAATIYANLGYIHYLQGNRDKATQYLKQGIPTVTLQDLVKDINTERVPEIDDEFEIVINRLWSLGKE